MLMRFTLIFLLAFTPAYGDVFTGKVVYIFDGDTFSLKDRDTGEKIKVRIASIDAPESRQPYGKESRLALKKMIYKKPVDVDCYKTDQYNRSICNVFKGKTDIALEMVRFGHAWHFKRFASEQSLIEYGKYMLAERQAYRAKTGLWQDNDPQPPWIWRSVNKRRKNFSIWPWAN
jgi:endonuclease YncB( thermonuclease family)